MTTVSTVDNSALLSDYIASQTESTTTTTKSDSIYSDYETFLKILTTQLQNQDPTEPASVSEFTAQLVQYAEVEQQIKSNDKLDSILSALNSNGITPLMSYVGAYVEAPSNGKLVVQNGQAILAYTLDEAALSSTIYVKNSSGNVIATLTGTTQEGLNRLVWDGLLDSGAQASDGTYSFSITAKDSSGTTMTLSDIRVTGLVTGIETNSAGEIVLKAGDLEIKDTNVGAVWASVGVAQAGSSGTESSTETAETTEETSEDESVS